MKKWRLSLIKVIFLGKVFLDFKKTVILKVFWRLLKGTEGLIRPVKRSINIPFC